MTELTRVQRVLLKNRINLVKNIVRLPKKELKGLQDLAHFKFKQPERSKGHK
jgi:hypothetical protein